MSSIKPMSPPAGHSLRSEKDARSASKHAAITGDEGSLRFADPLTAYSQGRLARRDAIRMLGLRNHAALLVALGDADLPMPTGTPAEIERQAATFAAIWRS
jgi:hypothetical protein